MQVLELDVAAAPVGEVRPHLGRVCGIDDEQPPIGKTIENDVVERPAGVVREDVIARAVRLHGSDVIHGERIRPRRNIVAAQLELRHV